MSNKVPKPEPWYSHYGITLKNKDDVQKLERALKVIESLCKEGFDAKTLRLICLEADFRVNELPKRTQKFQSQYLQNHGNVELDE